MAIFAPLGIGRLAMLAQQRALQVNTNNIANVNTPGYSRQRAQLSAIPEAAGYGVRVSVVERIVDDFLEARRVRQSSARAGAEVRRDLLARVQEHYPVEGSSIGTALDEFFRAANELTAHPEEIAVRRDLLDRAEEIAQRLRSAAGGLEGLQREVDGRLAQETSDASSILERIATLNRSIVETEADGSSTAGVQRDERQQALLDLARRLDVLTVERPNGSIDVFARASGAALVIGNEAETLGVEPSTSNGLDGAPLSRVGVRDAVGGLIGLVGELGGSIGGLLSVRDGALPDRAAELDLLATSLRDGVNAVQTAATGTDLDGSVGTALFTGTGARDFAVAITDPRKIAAAQGGVASDNTNALALAAIQTEEIAALGGVTFSDYFATLQAAAGTDARSSQDRFSVEDSVAGALDAQRDAVSGVSLEEEFTDLIRFQRGFQAAAQIITVSDRLLEDLMGIVR